MRDVLYVGEAQRREESMIAPHSNVEPRAMEKKRRLSAGVVLPTSAVFKTMLVAARRSWSAS
jgi:hypothetical protein